MMALVGMSMSPATASRLGYSYLLPNKHKSECVPVACQQSRMQNWASFSCWRRTNVSGPRTKLKSRAKALASHQQRGLSFTSKAEP